MLAAQPGSPEGLRQYSRELASRNVADDPRVQKLQSAKRIVWLFLLVCAFLFFYLIGKMQEAVAMLG